MDNFISLSAVHIKVYHYVYYNDHCSPPFGVNNVNRFHLKWAINHTAPLVSSQVQKPQCCLGCFSLTPKATITPRDKNFMFRIQKRSINWIVICNVFLYIFVFRLFNALLRMKSLTFRFNVGA